MTQTTKTNPTLARALALAGRGWKVFPCNPENKEPKTAHGFLDATTDPDQIQAWWQKYPRALIGIACRPSGIFALDIDRKNGKDGWKTLQALAREYTGSQYDPGPARQKTPSGGMHLIFTDPKGLHVPNNADTLGEGLDLRSDGYICTGPSYTWPKETDLATVEIPEAPAWLLDQIARLNQTKDPHPAPSAIEVDPSEAGPAWLTWAFEQNPRPGKRNDILFRMGLQLRDAGVLQAEAEGLAIEYAQRTGLPEGEATKTMQSAYNGPQREPAALPGIRRQAAPRTTGSNGHKPEPPEENPKLPPEPGAGEEQPHGPILETELGNSRRFTLANRGKALHVNGWGWAIWTGKKWEVDETGWIATMAKRITDQLFEEAQQSLEKAHSLASQLNGAGEHEQAELKARFDKAQQDANKKLKWAMQSQTAQKINAMLQLAESDLPARVDDFDTDLWLLNCTNGTLNLRTGELLDHDPARRITKIAGTHYDPAAQCPLWLSCLETWFTGDAELIAFIQRAVGYSLTGSTTEQALFFLHGTGKNGKSVFSTTLMTLLNDYSSKTPTETLMLKHQEDGVRNDLARLPGARAVIAAELPEGKRLNESLVKDLTGGDRMTVRFLHREYFEFTPTFKIWMYGNHQPIIRGTDEGIWRRIHKVPFTIQIPADQRDPNLPEKLKAELPGILAWAVRGCSAWQREGLQPAKAVQAATEAYRTEQDLLGGFISERLVTGPRCQVTAIDLYTEYKKWAEENGENSLSQRRFSQAMAERGHITNGRDPKTDRKLYRGLGLVDQPYQGDLL